MLSSLSIFVSFGRKENKFRNSKELKMIVFILASICSVLLFVYLFLVWPFDYWKKRGVNGPKPRPVVGNYPSAFTQKRHLTMDIQDIYEYVYENLLNIYFWSLDEEVIPRQKSEKTLLNWSFLSLCVASVFEMNFVWI